MERQLLEQRAASESAQQTFVLAPLDGDVGRHSLWVQDQYLEAESFESCVVPFDKSLDSIFEFTIATQNISRR